MTEAIRAADPQVSRRMIVDTRNRLIHGYLGIDNDMPWTIIMTEMPGRRADWRSGRGQQ